MKQTTGGPVHDVMSAIEIGGLEAVWVLAAHLYALVVPVVLVLLTTHHWDYLVVTVHDPSLLYIAAVLLATGSAFEVAQNTIDRWYLTAETASANGVGFCDLLAFWFGTAGQALVAIAIAGDAWWVVAIAAAVVVSFPILYLAQTAHFAPPSLIGILVAVLAYQAFGDPIIFLSVFLGGATMYFFSALLKTRAQVLHGLTTAAASSGIWFLLWAVHNGDAGTRNSWQFVGAVIVVAGVAMAAGWPFLSKLPASVRLVRSAD